MGDAWLPLLPTWLKRAGLDVVTWPGWATRSRSSGGYGDPNYGGAPILGIQRHHDAIPQGVDDDIYDTLRRHAEGHVYSPVGALVLERVTGRWGVVAAGATNTSGRSEAPLVCSNGIVPTSRGNYRLISIEAQNDGIGEEWSSDMLDSYDLGVAAIIDGLRRDGYYDARLDRFVELILDPNHPGDHHAHYEYTARKIDPADGGGTPQPRSRYGRTDDTRYGRWDMNAVRAATLNRLNQLNRPDLPTGDDDMPITATYEADDLDALAFRQPVLVQLEPVTLADGTIAFPSAAMLKLSVVNATHPGRIELEAQGTAFPDEDGDGRVDVNRGSFPAAAAGMGAFPISTLVAVNPISGQVRLRLNGSPDVKNATARVVVAVEAVWTAPTS